LGSALVFSGAARGQAGVELGRAVGLCASNAGLGAVVLGAGFAFRVEAAHQACELGRAAWADAVSAALSAGLIGAASAEADRCRSAATLAGYTARSYAGIELQWAALVDAVDAFGARPVGCAGALGSTTSIVRADEQVPEVIAPAFADLQAAGVLAGGIAVAGINTGNHLGAGVLSPGDAAIAGVSVAIDVTVNVTVDVTIDVTVDITVTVDVTVSVAIDVAIDVAISVTVAAAVVVTGRCGPHRRHGQQEPPKPDHFARAPHRFQPSFGTASIPQATPSRRVDGMGPSLLDTSSMGKRAHRGGPPILDHPGNGAGIIDPARIFARSKRLGERCVLCFFWDVLEELTAQGVLEPVRRLGAEGPATVISRLSRPEGEVHVVWPGIGAPWAASVLEELIGLGCRSFIAAGAAGVLDGSIEPGEILLPTAALRDEGTSYHYLSRGRWAKPDMDALRSIEKACRNKGLSSRRVKTWTTDGVYRETPAKIAQRIRDGCLAVEMEAAAFFAVARFRGVSFAQILYAGDDVSGERWKPRRWNKQIEARRLLFELAVDACLLG